MTSGLALQASRPQLPGLTYRPAPEPEFDPYYLGDEDHDPEIDDERTDEDVICDRGDHVIDEIGDDCAECLAYDD